LPERFGVTGGHLLKTQPPHVAATKEQQIRGGDAIADWIILVSGHDASALRTVASVVLNRDALCDNGAEISEYGEPFRLVHAMTPQDF
jgi:hypothetical protein